MLHLDHGKDFFITISARYIPSCFGRSIEQLMGAGAADPVHNVPVDNLIDFSEETNANLPTTNAAMPYAVPYAVPKQLHRLIHHITKYGLDMVIKRLGYA